MSLRDQLFSNKEASPSSFSFDKEVVSVFDDMVDRSVPMYRALQFLIIEFASRFLRPDSIILDLGCSTGKSLYELAKMVRGFNGKFIGIDSSQEMLDKAHVRCENYSFIHFKNQDLNQLKLDVSTSVVILNLTLQFVSPDNRQNVISQIYSSLEENGALLFVEKVIVSNSSLESVYREVFHSFKQSQGYSKHEILQKETSLEGVLIPYTECDNRRLLENSGFKDIEVFYRWGNFVGFIAVKR